MTSGGWWLIGGAMLFAVLCWGCLFLPADRRRDAQRRQADLDRRARELLPELVAEAEQILRQSGGRS